MSGNLNPVGMRSRGLEMNETQREIVPVPNDSIANELRAGRMRSIKGRGKSQKSLDLVAASHAILYEIHPATVRAVCYRLFTMKLIPSMATSNTNAVGKQLVWARETGVIPWNWIVDETRGAERIASWSDPEEILNTVASSYRKDYWGAQPNWVEVWSEKGTIRGTLAPVLEKYGVTFRVMHGYGSATALHGIAEETLRSDKWMTVLYLGDWDPSGSGMSEVDLPARMERYNGRVTVNRIALDADDVAPGTDLPSFEAVTKSKGPRHKWFIENYGHACWELDALSPVILRQRVDDEILALIDPGPWNQAVEVEAVEIASMSEFLGAWQGICKPASKYSEGGD